MPQQMDPSYYVPAALPPPGVIPNLDHPQSRATEAYIGMGVCLGITLVVVVLRIYVRLAITHLGGWDDLACLMGFALLVGQCAVSFTLMGPRGSLGRHLWDVRLSIYNKSYFQIYLVSSDLYAASMLIVKLSLFLLYLRLFKPNKTTRWLIYGGIFICGLFYPASIVSNTVLMMPKPGQPNDTAGWQLRTKHSALSLESLILCQGIFGILSDIYLMFIPIRSIFQLQLPMKKKVQISAVFMTATIAIACSICGVVYRSKSLSVVDQDWVAVPVYILSTAELSAGIVCSCMPILPGLLRDHTFKKNRLFSLHFFSSRFNLNPRRRLLSTETNARSKLHLDKRENSLEHEMDGYVGSESETAFVRPDKERLVRP